MFVPNDHYQPFWIWPAAFSFIGAIVGFFWLVNRIFPSTSRKRYSAAVGNALVRVGAVLEPSREHIIEPREYQQVDEDEGGQPPETGGRG